MYVIRKITLEQFVTIRQYLETLKTTDTWYSISTNVCHIDGNGDIFCTYDELYREVILGEKGVRPVTEVTAPKPDTSFVFDESAFLSQW